jgi:hypothetical protein
MHESLNGLLWFAGVSLVIYLFHRLKQAERAQIYDRIHRERMQAIQSGVPYPELPPYLIEREEKEESHVRKPFRASELIGFALILILGGAATMWALKFSGEDYHQRVWTFGAIPVFVGFGLVLYAMLNRHSRPE